VRYAPAPQKVKEKTLVDDDMGQALDDIAKAAEIARKAAGFKTEMEDILDEIDSVLEENAQEFVQAYVQKGGE
jgi:ubiquitin-like protein Pup